MVIAIDKATAVRMYDKVRAHWQRYRDLLLAQLLDASQATRLIIEQRVAAMDSTDMAVIVSQSQGELEEFQKKGLDIARHRRRLVTEDLDTKFKDPNNPLRIVFVCAMWLTGFDVPNCSTIYLDKPMRNHTLMQTIARANRVFPGKSNGLIVDYVGVFRNLQKALAIYGAGTGGLATGDELPVRDKGALVVALQEVIDEAVAYCVERGVDIVPIERAAGFDRIRLLDDAVELLVVHDDSKRRFLELADRVDRAFRAILPDKDADAFGPTRAAFTALAGRVRSETADANIDDVLEDVNALLDRSIAAEDGYIISAPVGNMIRDAGEAYLPDHLVDLSQIDFAALQAKFDQGRKHTAVERLKGTLNAKLRQMVRLNKSRMNYIEAFQQLIADYNAGATNIDQLWAQLFGFTQDLSTEEQRHVAEQMSEEELALFDVLTQPDITLSKAEKEQVKQIARTLIDTLKHERLVLDWRKKQQARASVQVAIEEGLTELPDAYDPELFQQKLSAVYQHIYEHYASANQNTYARAA